MEQNIETIQTDLLMRMHRSMVMIRVFEESVADLVENGELKTPCHLCIGQEAAAVGICSVLNQADTIWGAHRSHGHYLAKGGNLRKLMAEIFCRESGCSGGRGGSMHICDPDAGVQGTVPIVAATIPIAVGAALAEKFRDNGNVSVAFFGDGATEEGHFHESLNLAALNQLPIIFACENNLYSSHMGILERRVKNNLTEFGDAHGVASEQIDGNDIAAVHTAGQSAVTRARAGKGPTLLEFRTFRWRGHVGASWDWDVGVKRKCELETWLKQDPIRRSKETLIDRGVASDDLDCIWIAAKDEVNDAVQFARQSPHPLPSNINKYVYAAA
jgi:acetoin:2,6-dichlorophenolindophenol oxidoreductase subunit alpha